MDLKKLWYTLRIIPSLGLKNVLSVSLYRLSLKTGLKRLLLPLGEPYKGTFFKDPSPRSLEKLEEGSFHSLEAEVRAAHAGELSYFFYHQKKVGSPPDWFLNPFSGNRAEQTSTHWSKLNEFALKTGDIKILWEASRFYWLPLIARHYALTKNAADLDLVNQWLSDWTTKNPQHAGPNWKCGQETSIRLLNLLLSCYILDSQKNPSELIKRFVVEHCERISATLHYAIAQNNNHATSEAAALFVAGNWLQQVFPTEKKAKRWATLGRYWLENRVRRLIEEDGSFSQRSVNYHRVVLDTLCLVAFWQQHLKLQEFSTTFYQRAAAATDWLFQITDPETGSAPNFGANDGARLLNLSSCDYRDFRPSIQLASCLFLKAKAYEDGPWSEALKWLSLSTPDDSLAKLSSTELPQGGYTVIQAESSRALVHLPRYKFRPTQADILHLDLWHRGKNILRDSGSYSYHCKEPELSYFPSTAAHNTIELDKRDQMPRLSRFLFGEWPRVSVKSKLNIEKLSWEGGYKDYRGASHFRKINAKKNSWTITDSVSGAQESATLRWHLAPGDWRIEGNRCKSKGVEIEVSGDCGDMKLSESWESLYYMQKSKIPVLEVSLNKTKAIVKTNIRIED